MDLLLRHDYPYILLSSQVTNVLETAAHPALTPDVVESGGVSIHYSHAMQLLFFSFACGKSFAAPLDVAASSLTPIFPITIKTAPPAANSGNNKGSSSNGQPQAQQPLVGWCEVPGHPGLVTCLTQVFVDFSCMSRSREPRLRESVTNKSCTRLFSPTTIPLS